MYTVYLVMMPFGRNGGNQLRMADDSPYTTDLTRSGVPGTVSSVQQVTVALTTPSPARVNASTWKGGGQTY